MFVALGVLKKRQTFLKLRSVVKRHSLTKNKLLNKHLQT